MNFNTSKLNLYLFSLMFVELTCVNLLS